MAHETRAHDKGIRAYETRNYPTNEENGGRTRNLRKHLSAYEKLGARTI